VNVVELVPALTVTETGTGSAPTSLDAKATMLPPAGAA
jgi:hypothetical protein